MAGLRALAPVEFAGIGGPLMQAEGMESLFPMEELSVMGIAEVLPKYFALKRRIRQTADAVLASGAEALVTIDSPDFCLRVATLVKAARPEFRTIHYVAPSVWAWRPGRAAKMAKVIDHVLALLPFEPPYMTAAGMTCDFVGHPVVAEPRATAEEKAAFAGKGPLLLALPGSRRGEVTRLAPVFGAVVGRLKATHPGLQVALPTVRGVAGLAMGLAVGVLARISQGGEQLRLLLGVGVLGGFTTFSAFSLEMVNMVTRHQPGLAVAYAAASVLGSMAALFIGLWIVRGLGAV